MRKVANPDGINIRLRAAFIVPALVIMVLLGIAGALFPNLLRLATGLMPAVLAVALISLMLTERRRARNKMDR